MNLGPLPEGRRGAALALGLLAIALVMLWAGIVAPLTDWYEARARALGQQRAFAAHMAAIAGALPAMRVAMARAGHGASEGALLAGSSDAIAAAALQSSVEGIARSVGADLTSIAILPGEPAGTWRRIGLRVEAQGTFAVMVGFLEAVLSGTPPMLVDDLSLSSLVLDGPGQLPVEADSIAASFTIYAFRRGGSTVPSPGEQQAFAE
ncbi:MAG TPA: type II secretion system protein GspM [Acetobacteraceae bacterium]|nr:type II secretion system protein GspM [Acetobacteraceae bacterium]